MIHQKNDLTQSVYVINVLLMLYVYLRIIIVIQKKFFFCNFFMQTKMRNEKINSIIQHSIFNERRVLRFD